MIDKKNDGVRRELFKESEWWGGKKKENDRKLQSKVGMGPPAPAMIGRRWGKGLAFGLATCCLKPRFLLVLDGVYVSIRLWPTECYGCLSVESC